jgi:hypothetical protein
LNYINNCLLHDQNMNDHVYKYVTGQDKNGKPHKIEITYMNITWQYNVQCTRTYIPRVPKCLSARPNWDPPSPRPQASVSTPEPKGEETHSPEGKEVGGPNSDDWRKNLVILQCNIIVTYRYLLFNK